VKHLAAILILRPGLWLFDLGIALLMAQPGERAARYRQERRMSRGAWCAYKLMRGDV